MLVGWQCKHLHLLLQLQWFNHFVSAIRWQRLGVFSVELFCFGAYKHAHTCSAGRDGTLGNHDASQMLYWWDEGCNVEWVGVPCDPEFSIGQRWSCPVYCLKWLGRFDVIPLRWSSSDGLVTIAYLNQS